MMSECLVRVQMHVALYRTWVHGGCDLVSAAPASWRQPQRQPLLCCIRI